MEDKDKKKEEEQLNEALDMSDGVSYTDDTEGACSPEFGGCVDSEE
ncbi:MAG: hypothetical protein ACK5ML_04245 [Lachnospiraceae bacterium]